MSNMTTRESTPMPRDSNYLTPDEVAEELKLSTMTVYRIIRKGDMDAIRAGKSYRIPVEAYKRYLNNNRVSKEEG